MENIVEHIEEEDTPMEKTGYDAVPIHFRPGKGIIKKIKLVVPGFDDWMVKMTIFDGPEGTIAYTIDDEESDSDGSEPEGDKLEASENTAIDNVDVENNNLADEGPMDAEDIEMSEAEDENMEAMDNIIDDLPKDSPTDEEPEEPYAGILIALDSDAEQQVIVVRAMEGESDEDAVKRVLEDNDGYRVGTLEEAIQILGHSPLTSKDN